MSRVRHPKSLTCFYFSTTTVCIWPRIRRTCWSRSWRLRFLKFSREIRTTWLWGTSCTRFRLSSDTCKIRKCCRITTLRPDTTPMPSLFQAWKRSVTTQGSTWMTNHEQIMTVRLRLPPWENKFRDGKLKYSQDKEMFSRNRTMLTPWGKRSMVYNSSARSSKRKDKETKSRWSALENSQRSKSARILTQTRGSRVLTTTCSRCKKRLRIYKKWLISVTVICATLVKLTSQLTSTSSNQEMSKRDFMRSSKFSQDNSTWS